VTWIVPTYTMEFELAGVGGGWTDVTADLSDELITIDYGIKSASPNDRVASIGVMTFGLRNDADAATGRLLAWYSPYNAARRSGFGFDIRVRLTIASGADTTRWMGRLRVIDAVSGIYEERVVHCAAFDWMFELAKQDMSVALQVSQRSDQCCSALVAIVPLAPATQSIDVGSDTYVYGFDNIYRTDKALAACADLARSELGYIYTKRDSTNGQTFRFESRHTRPTTSSLRATFASTMTGLSVRPTPETIFNHVQVTVHPRRTDSGATTIVAKFDTASQQAIAPGQSATIFLNFSDAAQRDTFIGAQNIAPVTATTDYTMNSLADGTGTDLTASFTVTASVYGSSVKLVVLNTGSASGYTTKLQLRGDGIYALNPAVGEYVATTTYGDNMLQIDMPYQLDALFAYNAAAYLARLNNGPYAAIESVRFQANEDATKMSAGLLGDISDKLALSEGMSGITTASAFYVNRVRMELDECGNLEVEWGVVPADVMRYWSLGTAGSSDLGSTTILGL
jgi:hypothetical protein